MSKIAIIGGGIIGACAAIYLSRRQHNVTIIDAHQQLFSGSTAAAFGSLTPYSDPFFGPAIRRFAAGSVSNYTEDLLPRLAHDTGIKVPISEGSLIQLFEDEHEAKSYISKAEMAAASEHGTCAFRPLSKSATLRLEPNLTQNFHSAIEYQEPWLDLDSLLASLSAFLKKDPAVTQLLGYQVTSIKDSACDVVVELSTSAKHAFDTVVLATGASTSRILGIPTANLSLIRGDGAVAITQNNRPLLQRHVYMGKGFVTPRQDGKHLLGATYEHVVLPPADLPANARQSANLRSLSSILNATQRLVPALANCDVVSLWHGWRSATPSGVPYVGKVPQCERVYATLGFIGLGVTMAPAAGSALAKMIDGDIDAVPDELRRPQPDLWGVT